MCGRYALALRPSQIRRMLQDNDMPVWDAPADDGGDAGDYGVVGDGAGAGDVAPRSAAPGGGAEPRQTYNFAPGYYGVVYRADVPDWGAGPRRDKNGNDAVDAVAEQDQPAASADNEGEEVHYKLQSMKWGLIPFWTKRNPDYSSMMKTINCREDSLAAGGGMWSTMKARKRCIVIAQGFFEWLKTGPKEKTPHYVKRKDGKLMCFAGLWDCVQYEGDEQKNYTYTIITTDSNKQLKFLHDRMPVIFDPGSEKLRTWLDPARHEWSKELQALLRPYDGELEVYPVSKEVGKVGNNSPSFIVPVASRENKSNIANFFANAKGADKSAAKEKQTGGDVKTKTEAATSQTVGDSKTTSPNVTEQEPTEKSKTDGQTGGVKREAEAGTLDGEEPPRKIAAHPESPKKPVPSADRTISSTKNNYKSPVKSKVKTDGSQKITKFFSR